MSSIVIAGDVSGTCTLQANGAAGTTTLTLPTTSGVLYSTPTGGVIDAANGGTGLSSVGTSGNVLTSNGTTWVSSAPAAFDSGTIMLFGQTSAPTGWTKLTNLDNYALRVVSGTAGTGGSVAFTTAFASQTPAGSINTSGLSAGATTLSTSQIPSHSHGFGAQPNDYPPGRSTIGSVGGSPDWTASTYGEGGGGSHSHTISGSASFTGTAINLAVQYVDVIRASKN